MALAAIWHLMEGIGIYHVTLTVTSREPLLGRLAIPNNDPTQAFVEATELGRLLLDCQRSVPLFHPEIQILQYCLMPDHLHSIWYVRQPMEKSIRYVAQGFWRAAKKAGRAFTYLHTPHLHTAFPGGTTIKSPTSPAGPSPAPAAPSLAPKLSPLAPAMSRENPLRALLGVEAYSGLEPLFHEVPFLRPLSRRRQLQAMIRYVQLNPQRLATKRLMPGFFRVQTGIEIAGRAYSAVGNIAILQAERFAPVYVISRADCVALNAMPEEIAAI